jgi:hypothetical protein
MPQNNTGAVVVKAADLVPALLPADFAAQLEAIALEIESEERGAMMGIAKRITKAHGLFLYQHDEGGFTGWVQERLNYSVSTAYRLLDLDKRFGNGECFPNWETLPLSVLYLLAPPTVPEEAIKQVAECVAAGEKLPVAKAKKIIAHAKQKTTNGAAKSEPVVEDDTAAKSAEERKKHYAAAENAPDVPVAAGKAGLRLILQKATEEFIANGGQVTRVEPKIKASKKIPAKETFKEHWDRLTKAERRAALDEIGAEEIRAVASSAFKRDFEAAGGPAGKRPRIIEHSALAGGNGSGNPAGKGEPPAATEGSSNAT